MSDLTNQALKQQQAAKGIGGAIYGGATVNDLIRFLENYRGMELRVDGKLDIEFVPRYDAGAVVIRGAVQNQAFLVKAYGL